MAVAFAALIANKRVREKMRKVRIYIYWTDIYERRERAAFLRWAEFPAKEQRECLCVSRSSRWYLSSDTRSCTINPTTLIRAR